MPMTKQPLLFCTICFILGIFWQDFFQLNGKFLGVILGISILFLGLGLVKKRIFDKLKSIFLLHFFVVLGGFCHFLNTQTGDFLPHITENKTQNIVFQLRKKLNSNEKNKRYGVEILNHEKPFSVVISIPKEQEELDFRHYYSASAYLNPTQKPQHDYQFDYQKYLARQGIYVQGYIPNEISKTPKTDLGWGDFINQKRLLLIQNIDNSALQNPNKALLKGIILADRTEIDRDTIQNFSRTGLIHILAISGTHIGIIFMLILFVFKPIFSVKYRYFPIYISLSCIWIFAIFIGLGTSVFRACLMISIYYLMMILQRKPDTLHAIGLSALIILSMDTQQVFNIGFQLSFLAVLGIFGFYRPIVQYFGKPKNIITKWLINTFALTISAQIAVLPLTIFYFNQSSPMAILFNIPAIAFAQIFIVFSFLVCVLLGVNVHSDFILKIYDHLSSLFLKMVNFFTKIDFSFVENIAFSPLELVLFFGILYCLRKILMDFSSKNIHHFLCSIFVFVGVKMLIDVHFWQKEEILEHHFFKQNIISIKQGEQCSFLISDNTDMQKINNHIINPYITHRRIEHIQIKKLPENTEVNINGKNYMIK